MERLKKHLLIALLSIVILVFSKSFSAEFISWDDIQQITNNPNVTNGISFKNTIYIFKSTVTKMYQPISTLTFNIEYYLFGNNPFAFHIFILLIHLLNIFLVFKLFGFFLKNNFYSILATSIFALHPLNVEAIGWLSAQSTLIYATFYLYSMIYYIKFINTKSKKYYWFVLLFFIFSLFSKVMAVSLPIMLFAFDFYFKRTLNLKIVVEKIPFILLSFLFSLKALIGKSDFLINGIKNDTFSSLESIFLFPYQLKHYFIKFLYPNNLNVSYADPKSINIFIYSLIILLIAIIINKLNNKNQRKAIFGLLLFIIPLTPIFKIKPIGHSLLYDRYFYLSGIGLIFLIFSLFKSMKIKNKKLFAFAFYLIFITGLSYKTYSRIPVWNNSVSVLDDALKGNLNQYGIFYYQRGIEKMKIAKNNNKPMYFNLAIKDFTTAIKKSTIKTSWKSYFQKGLCNLALNNNEAALKEFNSSISIVNTINIINKTDLILISKLNNCIKNITNANLKKNK